MTPLNHCRQPSRRAALKAALGLALLKTAHAEPARPTLSREQTAAFRAWFVAIVSDQVRRPSLRWVHRDCAGLVRFAVGEALKPHDNPWRHAMGWPGDQLSPPDVALRLDQQTLRQPWLLGDGSASHFASAIALVQHNARFIGKARNQALPGDLLFFDQGDDQHLMVWTGRAVAYHNGAAPQPNDNGLRWQRWEQLMTWPDTRWRPVDANPNFAGVFRLAFLAD
jgi:uncharacterized protein YfaT (DUF1175 family)